MSDRMTNVEIEDVLASIRRLLSDDIASARGERPRSAQGPGKLVLTPSTLVSLDDLPDEASIRPDVKSDRAGADQGEADVLVLSNPVHVPPAPSASAPSRAPSLEDRIAELEAALSATAEEWEPDGSEGEEPHRPTEIVVKFRSAHRRMEEPAAVRDEFAIPTPEAVPAPDDDPWAEVDGAIDAMPEGETLDFDSGLPEVALTAPGNEPDPHEQDESDPSADVAGMPYFPADDLDDEPEADLATASRPVAEDEALSDTGAEPEQPQDVRAPTDIAAAGHEATRDGEADLIDEEALQRLISRVIREELQGRLGEQLTRNIRRLIRREIRLAQEARNVD